MTKIDIFSGFLGAGKTTLIKKLIKEAYKGEKLVLIENEFGDIGIDGGFMKDSGIQINELNSGCICCSLVGDFAEALNKVYKEYKPDRILIEPSGVGKLSDVIRAVEKANLKDCKINSFTAVVDASKCKMYMKNFGEFFNDQIDTAACIIFSHADVASPEKLKAAVGLVRARKLVRTRHVGVAENYARRGFNLIVEKLAEVLHIHLALPRIHNRSEGVYLAVGKGGALHRTNDVRKLAHARRLD